ncbi:glycosyltransferase family 2 protein [Pontivivens ytuae]|uniref:Glycosyltransferase n=1 Tax=Pontivivens ytuae TaxID=2789856 RepID=A0A7S9LV17_9RHOB|nr:glycosyltransferase [Pontivivens ytuae]QPH55847.1 glycosyltransferase [Pontivivens ytuae]
MRAAPSVSVVIPNRGRAELLDRALIGLRRQWPVVPEIVVVSDRAEPHPLADIWVHQPEPNVARARNAGINAAHGAIIAFLDDDAVPAPGWLEALLAAFEDPAVEAAGGPVLGPDGETVQWDRTGFNEAGEDGADHPHLKLNGTNMAVRRSTLARLGGFDERYAYFLDETDLLLRVYRQNGRAAWCTDAVVHHHTATNAVRGRMSTAEGFRVLGRSKATFCATHLTDQAAQVQAHADFAQEQRRRLLNAHQFGRLSGKGVSARQTALIEGLAEPVAAPKLATISEDAKAAGHPSARPRRIALIPRLLGRRAARRAAARLADSGAEVFLIELRWLRLPPRTTFRTPGYWWVRRGLFGTGYRYPRFTNAAQNELNRLKPLDSVIWGTTGGDAKWVETGEDRPPETASARRISWADVVLRSQLQP